MPSTRINKLVILKYHKNHNMHGQKKIHIHLQNGHSQKSDFLKTYVSICNKLKYTCEVNKQSCPIATYMGLT